jgi:hypothetical protein
LDLEVGPLADLRSEEEGGGWTFNQLTLFVAASSRLLWSWVSPFLGRGQGRVWGLFFRFPSPGIRMLFEINFLWTWFVAEEVSASQAARRDAHADFDRCLFQFASEQLRISCLLVALRSLSS